MWMVSAPILELRFFVAKKQIGSLYTFRSLNIPCCFLGSICDAINFKAPRVQTNSIPDKKKNKGCLLISGLCKADMSSIGE
jgi:hypothetical protein